MPALLPAGPALLAAALLLLSVEAVRPPKLDQHAAEVRTLELDTPRLAERISIGGEPVRYRLAGLQHGKGYEVRVSFPGTNPVRARLWLEGPSSALKPSSSSSSSNSNGSGTLRELRMGGEAQRSGGSGRKLLDAEKIMFGTDAEGRVWLDARNSAFSSVDVLFRVEPWGRWRRPELAPQQLVYDIVLERSSLGVPHSALPLLTTAVVLFLLAAAAVPWWGRTAVPAILRWLHGWPTPAAAASAGSPRPNWRTPLMAS